MRPGKGGLSRAGTDAGMGTELTGPGRVCQRLPPPPVPSRLVLLCPAGIGDISESFVLGKVTWAHRPPKAEPGAGIALGLRQNEKKSKSETLQCGEQGFGPTQEQEPISKRDKRFVVGQGVSAGITSSALQVTAVTVPAGWDPRALPQPCPCPPNPARYCSSPVLPFPVGGVSRGCRRSIPSPASPAGGCSGDGASARGCHAVPR